MKEKKVEVMINGMKEKIPLKMSIAQLIDFFEERDDHLIVECDGQFVFPQKYATTIVRNGDQIEFIHPSFGG